LKLIINIDVVSIGNFFIDKGQRVSSFISPGNLINKILNNFTLDKYKNIGSIKNFEKQKEFQLNYFTTKNGISYVSFSSKSDEDIIIDCLTKEDVFFITFNMDEDIILYDKNLNKEIKFDSNTYYIGQRFKNQHLKGIYKKEKNYCTHYIIFNNSIYNYLFNDFCNKPIIKSKYLLLNQSNKINNKQKLILNELLQASYKKDKLQEIYLESKILDLFYITTNSLKKDLKENNNIYLSTKDIESLNKAKKILIENMTNPPSLKNLAYKSAINEFKLKKGFKQLFNNTVYGLLQEHRLNKAKSLLETKEVNISEASSLVGYKSISHFSKIFKEQFGITPIQIKKTQRNLNLKYYKK